MIGQKPRIGKTAPEGLDGSRTLTPDRPRPIHTGPIRTGPIRTGPSAPGPPHRGSPLPHRAFERGSGDAVGGAPDERHGADPVATLLGARHGAASSLPPRHARGRIGP